MRAVSEGRGQVEDIKSIAEWQGVDRARRRFLMKLG